VLAGLHQVGIDFDAVTWQLLNEGMRKFTDPYDRLLEALEKQRETVLGPTAKGPEVAGVMVEDALEAMEEMRFGPRLHARDSTLWTTETKVAKAIANRLGWLDCVETFEARKQSLSEIARAVKAEGMGWTVLMGMGGSSLWPEVSTQVFGARSGWPELVVVDSTDPEAVRWVQNTVDLSDALFIVSSKSGTTKETMSLYRHFFAQAEEALKADPGHRFMAITDPQSPLEREGRERHFRKVFINPEDIGGRYSALSYFGLVPMALLGLDLPNLLGKARDQLRSCDGALPVQSNSGIRLGTTLGALARKGRDKITIMADPGIEPFSLWLEQLLAESTGKEENGLLPIVDEPLGSVEAYGKDRVFVHLTLAEGKSGPFGDTLVALEAAGHPVISMEVDGPAGLAAEIIRWEVATAAAGAVLGVNPFDEPNVAESKANTRELLHRWNEEGGFGVEPATASQGDLEVWSQKDASSRGSPVSLILGLLAGLSEGDYLALLPYCRRTESRHRLFQQLRTFVREKSKIATTLGYGPRYLHSTGQLHKGGPAQGAYIIFTADATEDVAIPGEDYGFGTLIRAQALGDFRALQSRGRRVLRVHLGPDIDKELQALMEALL